MKISATVITLNEERHLAACLETLSFCDEIVVVDSGSEDRTLEIAAAHGAVVIQNPWPGYAGQKNLAADSATNDWILSLDADEALSDELAAQIRSVSNTESSLAGYRFPRRTKYFGRWILHGGWYPDRKIRLYDRRKARWIGDYVHESVTADGAVGDLRGDLLHDTCDSIADHLSRVNRYTTLAAREIRAAGGRAGLTKLTLSPVWAFVKTYVVRRGFLDGFQGFLIAVFAAFYVFLKYAKARWEIDGV